MEQNNMNPEDERKSVYEKWLADDAKNVFEMSLKADKDRHDEEPEDEVQDAVFALISAAGDATSHLIDCRKALLDAMIERNVSKSHYEDARRDAYLMGVVTGKNEAERDARLASVLEVQIQNLRRADIALLKAQNDFDCAMDVMDAHRLMGDLQMLAV